LPIALTVPEAAALLRVGRTLAYELVHQWHTTGGAKGLRSVRVGRSLRIPRTALIEFLDIAHPGQ
jgi:excisionase family DNA binding protein